MFFFLVAAAFNKVAHVAVVFFFNEEGIIFIFCGIGRIFAQIHILDACGLVVGLFLSFDVFEAHQFNLA